MKESSIPKALNMESANSLTAAEICLKVHGIKEHLKACARSNIILVTSTKGSFRMTRSTELVLSNSYSPMRGTKDSGSTAKWPGWVNTFSTLMIIKFIRASSIKVIYMERVLSLLTNISIEAWSRMGSLMALVVMKISKHMLSMRVVLKKVKEMGLVKNQIMSLDSICRSMKVSGKPISNMVTVRLRSRNPTMIKYSILKEFG